MTQFTKKSFNTVTDDGKGGKVLAKRNGYEFTAFAVDGKVFKMNVYQGEDGWRVIDPMTGLSLCKGETRAKAVENATTPTMVRNFSNMIKLDDYGKMVDRYIDLSRDYTIAAEKDGETVVVAEVEHHELPKPKAEPKPAPKAAKKSAPKPPAKPKSKAPTKPEKDDIASLVAKLASLEKEIAELKAGKLTAEQEATAKAISDAAMAAETVSLSELLVEMRGWCKERDNVIAERKDDNMSCVRILGVKRSDQATQKELADKGFRWSKKGFWYYGEVQARAQGKVAIA